MVIRMERFEAMSVEIQHKLMTSTVGNYVLFIANKSLPAVYKKETS